MESAEKNPPSTMTIETRELPDVYNPQAAWYEYRDCINGGTAGTLTPEQEKECLYAFYAGIECAFRALEHTIDQSEGPEEERSNILLITMRKLTRIVLVTQNPGDKSRRSANAPSTHCPRRRSASSGRAATRS